MLFGRIAGLAFDITAGIRAWSDSVIQMRSQKVSQLLLALKYKELAENHLPLPSFDEVEFRAFSQNGEDGILLFIFSVIGTTNKTAIEICAGDGIQCNSANLIINHGWKALLVDGNEKLVRRGRRFYSRCFDTLSWPPQFIHAWITAENVNDIISQHRVPPEIDLLVLDIDGVDYWVWKAIDCIQPRVVLLEYQDIWGEEAVTVPYDPSFDMSRTGLGSDYCGASLPAFVGLGREKGYRLIGCQRYGFNAIFLRAGVAESTFPEIAASDCLRHPKVTDGITRRQPRARQREWIHLS